MTPEHLVRRITALTGFTHAAGGHAGGLGSGSPAPGSHEAASSPPLCWRPAPIDRR
jgi:hypothetical protein